MASGPLLETKFYAPRWRPGLVSRPRLLKRLERGAHSRLTLVSAPAGFGKTTLLAEWFSRAPDGPLIAWLSLDQGDAQPSAFWTYLIASLERVRPGVGTAAMALMESPGPPPPIESLLTAVLNDVGAVADDIVLVLDDYHLIETREIHEGITFLLDHLPPNLHLVITGRADPPLPLARLRGRGEMSELRAADLRFTAEEAATFLNDAMELSLSVDDVARLDARTEGWIAGLQLAALSMQGRDDVTGFVAAFSGDDRYIVDYLVEEVLDQQPPHLRQFLLQTSILERLTGPLCDAVTETPGGRATLERLERGNLFVVPLDDRREWYRYQHLFADVLQAHLREEQPEQVRALHLRASLWFEQGGMTDSAVEHARAAGDHEGMARLLAASFEEFARRGHYGSLMGWLASLPEEMVRERPRLALIYARCAIASQNTNEMPRKLTGWAEAAIQRIEDSGGLDPADDIGGTVVGAEGVSVLRGELLALKLMHSARGLPPEQVAQMAAEALALLPPGSREHLRGTLHVISAGAKEAFSDLDAAEASFDRIAVEARESQNVTLLVSTLNHRGQTSVTRGRLNEARAIFEDALQAAEKVPAEMNWVVCSPHTSLAEIFLERNELASAREHAVRATDAAGTSPGRSYVLYAWAAAAQVFLATEEYAAGLAQLRRAEAFVHGSKRDRFASFLASVQLDFLCRSGDLETAGEIVRARRLAADDALGPNNELEMLAFARYLVTSGAPASAESLLGRLVSLARDAGRGQQEIRALVLRALACDGLGDRASALDSLAQATRLAEPGGYVRTFAAEAGIIPSLKALAEAAGSAPGAAGAAGSTAYLRALLTSAGDRRLVELQPRDLAGVTATSALAEPLTARELEILRLVSSGMRNQEIADHLVISLPTVKRHIANVYGKLGVTHRTEAVALANDLALL